MDELQGRAGQVQGRATDGRSTLQRRFAARMRPRERHDGRLQRESRSGAGACTRIRWIASSTRSSGSPRSSSASSPPTSSSRCCCAISSATSIPDSYDFGRLLLGILIFWGIAATSYRGTHITVDLVWADVGPRCKRVIDVFATLVLLFVVTVQTYTLFDKVRGTYADNVLTFDLQPADLAVLRRRLARRRLGGAADRRPHLPADLPAGSAGRDADQIKPVE